MTFNKGTEIIKEDDKSETLYLIKEGQCIMYKKIEAKDMLGIPKKKPEKIMNIEAGGIFGEDGICFDNPNNYSIKAMSKVTCLAITYDNLRREFKRLLPSLTQFFYQRNTFIQERYD